MLVVCGALAALGVDPAAGAQTYLPCPAFTSEALPPPAPRTAAWPVKRFEAIKEQLNAPYRVLFLGDSLVEHFEIAAGPEELAKLKSA